MADRTALIVDDEPDICELLEMSLSTMGVTVRTAGNVTDAKKLLQEQGYNVCITDMRLRQVGGTFNCEQTDQANLNAVNNAASSTITGTISFGSANCPTR